LFADAGSVTPKSNPFNTDANGYGSFYVTDGRYRIQATDIDWRDTDIFISPTFYAQLAGGPLANFTAMPQVGGDPIVESGSNADGEWTRWSDGTQVCTTKDEVTDVDFAVLDNVAYYPSSFAGTPYPNTFTSRPIQSISPVGERPDVVWVASSGANTISDFGSAFLFSNRVRTNISVGVEITCIGRWK